MTCDDKVFSYYFPEIFHYTNIEGFCGIIDSATLWSTHYRDLNDKTELQRYKDVLSKWVAPLCDVWVNSPSTDRMAKIWLFSEIHRRYGTTDPQKAIPTYIIDCFHEATYGELGFRDMFVTSFCIHTPEDNYTYHNGLLSQWRGYASAGGVAIVFRSRAIEDLLKRESDYYHHPVLHITDVIYDNNREIDKKLFCKKDVVIDAATSILDSIGKRQRRELPKELLKAIVMTSTVIKHHAFREEGEARIVCAPHQSNERSAFAHAEDQKHKSIRFRRRGPFEARYVELFRREDQRVKLPIRRVIVGPSPHANVNLQEVKEILSKNGMSPEIAAMSDIPFSG